MSKYKNIYKSKPSNEINSNFQQMLLMSLTEDSDDKPTTDSNSNSICYITHEPLKDYSDNDIYTLSCGHTFLKSALFNEVRQQKESDSNTYKIQYFRTLGSRRFICPYCRELHKYVLPAWIGYPMIPHVNAKTKPLKKFYCMHEFKNGKHAGEYCGKVTTNHYCCSHKSKNKQTDENESIDEESLKCQAIIKSGSRKGQMCGNKKKQTLCIKGLTVHLCGKHSDKSGTNYSQSTTVGAPTPVSLDSDKCQTILKSGKRKGQHCGCKPKIILNGFPYCDRHYKSTNTIDSLDYIEYIE